MTVNVYFIYVYIFPLLRGITLNRFSHQKLNEPILDCFEISCKCLLVLLTVISSKSEFHHTTDSNLNQFYDENIIHSLL